MSIYDLITSQELSAYWEEINTNASPYFGETLFPNRSVDGIDLKWIKGRSGIPVVLRPSAFDVNVIPRNRAEMEMLRVQMPFFKESYYIDEELRQKLIMIVATNNQNLVTTILGRIFDDAAKLIEAAAVARERMRMGVITTGVLAFAANGQAFEFDYGLDPDQLRDATVPWTTPATATPIDDIQAAIDYLETTTDSTPARILMNRYTFNLFKATDQVRNGIIAVNNFINTTGFVSNDVVMQYVEQLLGLEIVINNKTYRDESETVQKYVPDGVVTILPAGTLGYTNFGTTPEEADLLNNASSNVAIVDTGVAVTTMVREDPVSVETKVSQICMPSFEAADTIVILDVTN